MSTSCAPPGLPKGELLPAYQARRLELLAARGLDVSGFAPEQMTSAEDIFCFPNVVGPMYPGSAILFRARPYGLDPGPGDPRHLGARVAAPRCRAAPGGRRDVPDWADRDWGEITNQDYANMAEVQIGMKSAGFEGLRLNPRQEANLLHMHRVIDSYLEG